MATNNRELDHAFINLNKKHRTSMKRLMANTEANALPVHPWFLRALYNNPGCTQKEISETLQVTPASITANIKKAEACGLLHREADKYDQRRTNVYLTQKGQEVICIVDELIDSISDAFFYGFNDEEKALLSGFFSRMDLNLDSFINDEEGEG